MDNEELQRWVSEVSLLAFNKPFLHRARFNARLRTTGGRYLLRSHDIEINPHQIEKFGRDEVEKIIKHELCHYHLHLEKKGYRHQDQEFKELLKAVGGTRFCRLAGERNQESYKYQVSCPTCKTSFKRKRRFNVKRFVCAKCRGKLILKKIVQSG